MTKKKDLNRLRPLKLFKFSKNDEVVHSRRNMWGIMIRPSESYGRFKENKVSGFYHPNHTWRHLSKAYRKKVRKMKIAKYSRKGIKRRIKRAR